MSPSSPVARVSRLRKVMALAFVAVLAPACGEGIPFPIAELPPYNDITPATNVAHWPLIVIKWNEPMDPATINASTIGIYLNTGALFDTPIVRHLDATNETLVMNQSSLLSPTATPNSGFYIVGGSSAITSLSGHSLPIGQTTVLTWFFAKADTNAGANPITLFSTVTPSVAGATSINLDFDLGTVSGGATTDVSYDVYHSTTLKGEDLMSAALMTVSGTTAAANAAAVPLAVTKGRITVGSLAAATTHYFIVVARVTNGASINNVLPAVEVSLALP